MRVLVAVVAKEEELVRARRHLGYERLVVVVPRKPDEALRKAAALPNTRVVEAPDDDLLGCLATLEAVLDEHRKDEVRVAVDGGTSTMSAGAFLACLSRGVEAWFLLHKAVRLPVLRARPVAQRFNDDQLAVLRALHGSMKAAEVARAAGLPEGRATKALYDLKRIGAVQVNGPTVAPTDLARYYQRALAA